MRALLACAGVAIIGLAQRAIINQDVLSRTLTSARLDRTIDAAMHAQNTVAGAIPFFIAGGVVFALNAAFVERRERSAAGAISRSRTIRLLASASIGLAVALSAWLNWRLWHDEWQRWYPAVFFGGLLLGGIGFLILDLPRLRVPRLNPWLLLEIIALLALIGTFIGITVRDLGTWRYSAVGDEGTFYTIAYWIRHEPDINWLSQSAGAFEYHPALGSAWHTLNLMIFGWGLFGWQMGSLMAVVVTLPFFWWLLRELWGWRAALFGTAILSASHYLIAYSHTGYDNLFAIPPTVAALACAVAGLNRRNLALLFLAGVFAGLGFHTFYSSRIAIALVGAAIVLRFRREDLSPSTIAPIALGFVMTILPLFASDGWRVIDDMEAQSIRNSGYPLGDHLRGNAWRTLFGFHFSTHSLHYTSGQLLDPVSVTFATAGLFLCVAQARDYGSRLVLAWFVGAAVTAGVLSSYTTVSVSRLHFVLPALAAMGGIALDRLVVSVADAVALPRARAVLAAGALVVIAPVLFYVNGKHFFEYSAARTVTTFETVFVRELTSKRCEAAPLRDVAVMQSPDPLLDGTWYFMERRGERPVQFEPRDLRYSYLPLPMGADTGCLAIAYDEAWMESQAAIAAIENSQNGNVAFSVETDLTGRNKLLLVPPTTGGTPSDFTAWPLTDFSQGDGQGLAGVMQGQVRDAIAAIDAPLFTAPPDAGLNDLEPVAIVEIAGDVRAYPLRLLAYHAVVNDTVGGVPVAVTYDPISAASMAYERTVDDRRLTFAATGMLRYGNALLYDRETESWWQQMDGAGVIGALSPERLRPVPVRVVPATVMREAYPQAQVLRPPESTEIDYIRNPYLRYEYLTGRPLFQVATDDRLEPMRRVAVIGDGAERIVVPFPDAAEGAGSVREISVGGRQLVLLYDWRTRSGLDARGMANSGIVGSITAFEEDPGVTLEPGVVDFGDPASQTRWTSAGVAVEGPAKGATLTPVAIETGFWFSVAARYPGITIAE